MTTYTILEKIALKILNDKLDEMFEERLVKLCIAYDRDTGVYPEHEFEGLALFKAYKEDDFKDRMIRDIYGPSLLGPSIPSSNLKEYTANWAELGVVFE